MAINSELILAFNSLPPDVPLIERMDIAAEVGFAGIGVSVLDHQLTHGGVRGAAALRRAADGRGIRIAELEPAIGFDGGYANPASAGGRPVPWGPASIAPEIMHYDQETERAAFELANEAGANHIVAIGSWGTRPHDVIVDEFAALCDRAIPHGLEVALEFVVGTSVATLEAAAKVVAEAGRQDGGLCLDTWHLYRGGHARNELGFVGPARITVVQLSDGVQGKARQSVIEEIDAGLHERRIPGEGEFDLAQVLTTLSRRNGSRLPPISIEVLSDELRSARPREVATAMFAGTMETLQAAAARSDTPPCGLGLAADAP